MIALLAAVLLLGLAILLAVTWRCSVCGWYGLQPRRVEGRDERACPRCLVAPLRRGMAP